MTHLLQMHSVPTLSFLLTLQEGASEIDIKQGRGDPCKNLFKDHFDPIFLHGRGWGIKITQENFFKMGFETKKYHFCVPNFNSSPLTTKILGILTGCRVERNKSCLLSHSQKNQNKRKIYAFFQGSRSWWGFRLASGLWIFL